MIQERTISINFRRLNEYIDGVIDEEARVGKLLPGQSKTGVIEAVANVLVDEGLWVGDRNLRQQFYRFSRQARVVHVQLHVAERLMVAIHGEAPLDFRKRIAAWTLMPTQRSILFYGNAERGEVEITRLGTDSLITKEHHSPIDRYVSVYVDEVRFRQRDEAGEVKVGNGRFIRIETPGDPSGAIVLPVDRERGRVLLVTQFRHPQRRWITEAPRGFGVVGIDKDAAATARRELWEETGARVIETSHGEQLIALRSLYTDTGKLLDRPTYFLAFVRGESAASRAALLSPLMEDPAWLPIGLFYESVFDERGARVRPDDVEYVFEQSERRRFFAKTPLEDEGILHVEDAFTVTAALLALPYLRRDPALKSIVP